MIAGLQAGGLDPGFVWCDAHADFHTPATGRFGSLDCQGLAMLTGRAWRELVRQTGLRPLRDNQVVLVGARAVDLDELRALESSGIGQLMVESFRDHPSRVGFVESLTRLSPDGVHVHVDADVLDPSLAPASDYAEPGGLESREIRRLVEEVASRSTVTSISVASYDAGLDPEGALAGELIGVVVDAVGVFRGR